MVGVVMPTANPRIDPTPRVTGPPRREPRVGQLTVSNAEPR